MSKSNSSETTSTTSGGISVFGGSKPIFGGATTATKSDTSASSQTSVFGGMRATKGFSSFASAAGTGGGFLSKGKESSASSEGIKSVPSFGDPKKLFGGDAKEDNENESDSEADTSFVPNVSYKPAVPLPALVEVKSGEDDEVKFSGRCKFYAFDKETKSNRERGRGNIKIMRNPNTGKYRCVMRREQVLKLCANFPFIRDMKITQKGTLPAYFWACKDFSEDITNGTDECFTVVFKDERVANEFHHEFVKASKNTTVSHSSTDENTASPKQPSEGNGQKRKKTEEEEKSSDDESKKKRTCTED